MPAPEPAHDLAATSLQDDDEDPPTKVAHQVDLAALAGTLALSPEERDHPIPPEDPPTEETPDAPPRSQRSQVSNGAVSQRAAASQVAPRSHPGQLLPGAPAAVQAAAKQVMDAHRMRSSPSVELSSSVVKKAPTPPPSRPGAPPARSSQPKADPSPKDAGHPTAVLAEGTVVNARYRVERLIGRGGMGTVYAVRHANTDEKLALKLLHPALAENEAAVHRFRTEARAPVRIESEHVVRVVDADVAEALGRVPYIVMERLRGQDLRSELKRRGALPAGEVVLYLSQVARALDKAHNLGIVHRDMKPANLYVMRREDGSPLVKVLDFGIAKLTDDAAKELTVAGQVFGTPWYMAPEQARGELGQVGPQTDLWALGLIAFQLLTGQNYWTADGMAALVGQICYEAMPPPTQRAPHLGPLFDMWFSRACNRDPTQRFPSARSMIDQLAQALGVNQVQGITTGEGHGRHMDSSLQIGGSSMGQSAPGMSWSGAPSASVPPHGAVPHVVPDRSAQYSVPDRSAQYSVPDPSGQYSIPGTVLQASHPFDRTNAPLYTTNVPERPTKSKPSRSLPVVLGIVIALLVAATGLGVYLSLPTEPGTTNAASVPTAEPAPTEPETPVEPDEEPAPEPTPDDLEEDPLGEEEDEPDEQKEPETKTEPPKTAKAPSPGSVPVQPRPQPPATPTPKPKAPKVGKIKF